MALGERGRNPLNPRSTAEAACALRAAGALEGDPTVRCPDAMAAGFLGGLNVTTLAKHKLGATLVRSAVERRTPGAYPYEIARAKFIDEVVLGEVERGLDELVLLGAGLDSRPYRLAEQLRGVRTIEVDHPVSQESKRARLRRLLGEEPAAVTYVGIDFNRDDLGGALDRAGHDRAARTLFLWSGVSMYLPEQAVSETLEWVAAHGAGSSIVFDAAWAEMVDGSRDYYGAAELRAVVARLGEPLRWGIPEGRVEETLSGFGLTVERIADEAEARREYLTRADGSLLGRPYGFGVLVHARAV